MSMDQGPVTPTSPNAPSNRPRPRSRGISFRSDKSGGSDNSKPKYVESPRQKAQRDSIWKGTSKANPNAAINETQPGEANLTEQSTLQNLRSVQHKDGGGNVIADPDLSNPTRPRLERPLDTIRSFEKAIDDGYKRRNSYMKQDTEQWDQQNQYASRRSSYFGGEYRPHEKRSAYTNPMAGDAGPGPNRQAYNGGGGYYSNQRPDGHGGPGGPPRARYASSRMQSDPQIYGHPPQRPYPQHNHHSSHDTVNTGMTHGSDSTGPWANSTDPSSENSSIDRPHNKPPTPMDSYNGYSQNGPIMEEQGYGTYPQQKAYDQRYNHVQENDYEYQNGYARNDSGAPAVQPTNSGRKPIQLGGGGASNTIYSSQGGTLPSTARPEEKRKSWIKRRFSKN